MKALKLFVSLMVVSIFLNLSHAQQYNKVNSEGLDIYYRIYGEGKPLLILGGGPGDVSRRYVSLCELLSKNFQCILVDQRGTGKSSPAVYDSSTINISLTLDDFEAIRNQLGYKTWNVLGFSYGGYLASLYTKNFSSSVSSLVLLNSMGLNTDAFLYFRDNILSRMLPGDIDLMKFWSDSARIASAPQLAQVEKIRAMMPGYFFDRKKSLIVSQDMKYDDFDFTMGNLIWTDIVKLNLDLAEMKNNFSGPVLILGGRQDPLGESIPIALSNYYKNSKRVFIEKSGHYSWVEQPDRILTEINNFLK